MKDVPRDESVGRLLERALRSRGTTNSPDDCPDAGMLAAWSEGSLTAGELAGVEAHAADCARCQAHLAAMVRMRPAETPQSAIRWLVPVTAAAAALVVWIWVQPGPVPATDDSVVPRQARAPEAESSAPAAAPTAPAAPTGRAATPPVRAAEPSPRGAAPPAIADASPRAQALQEKSERSNTAERRREQSADSGGNVRRAAPADAPGAPASAAAAAPTAAPVQAPAFADLAAQRSLEIVSAADAAIRWRASGSVIQRSTDAGATWQPQSTGIDAVYTAGASPQPTVCWLVGRRGVVLLSTDGQTWRRLPFPEAVDLVAIAASSASSASVTTADGRVLITADAGRTWRAVP